MTAHYPVIRVAGSAHERGRQIGSQVADRVAATITGYRSVFASYADLNWDEARASAAEFVDSIKAVGEKYFAEMQGIAEGAGVDLLDIVAVNCRTEIMFSGMARKMLAGEALTPPAECTAFAALPERTESGQIILGQNWDWLSFAADTVIIVVAEQDDGPDFITVVEAGLLAKAGLNSAGIGVVTNALVSSADAGTPGMPYHLALRRILDSETFEEAASVLESMSRASSANYLIGSADGSALDLECSPGDASGVRVLAPRDGYLAHTNHFQKLGSELVDLIPATHPDTISRLRSIESNLEPGQTIDETTVEAALSSHEHFPFSVCTHFPAEGHEPMQHNATIASVILNLNARTLRVASGNPCTEPYVEVGFTPVMQQ